jgi:hypothetical protein
MSKPARIGLLALVVAALAMGALNLMFNRSFTKDVPVYSASRWTAGNRIFPTQIAVKPAAVVRYTPKLFGSLEQTIAIDQISSVKIVSGVLFADVLIETTGGSQPIVCHGHWKKDAESIRDAINKAQSGRRGARS